MELKTVRDRMVLGNGRDDVPLRLGRVRRLTLFRSYRLTFKKENVEILDVPLLPGDEIEKVEMVLSGVPCLKIRINHRLYKGRVSNPEG